MLSLEEYRRLLGDEKMSDKEIAELRDNLSIYVSKFLDDYFKDEIRDDEV